MTAVKLCFLALLLGLSATILWGCVNLRSRAYTAAVGVTILIIALGSGGIFFQYRPLSLFAVCLAIAGYLYFSFASFAIRPKKLGIVAGTVLSAPIVIAILTLPFTALGLGFILSDVLEPYKTQQMRDGTLCRIREYGMAASDEGVQVELVRPILGIAYHTVYAVSISYIYDPYSVDPCGDAFSKWKSSRR